MTNHQSDRDFWMKIRELTAERYENLKARINNNPPLETLSNDRLTNLKLMQDQKVKVNMIFLTADEMITHQEIFTEVDKEKWQCLVCCAFSEGSRCHSCGATEHKSNVALRR